MRTTETEAYKPPRPSSLKHSYRLRADLTGKDNSGDLSSLADLASDLGFNRVPGFGTKKGSWELFDRPFHEVPNFPEGETAINSSLALYKRDDVVTQAVLRTSTEAYTDAELVDDLDAITKHYIERPRLFGFPSKEGTTIRNTFSTLVIGTVITDAIGYQLTGQVINLGAFVGELSAPAIHGAGWLLGEMKAKRSISDLDQYTVGSNVENALQGEQAHVLQVAVQRELYQALRQDGAELTPDQFLEKIYGQMPTTLLQRRREEIEALRHSGQGSALDTRNTLPGMLDVARVLQAA